MGTLLANRDRFLLFLRWAPRIACILFAAFLSLFSLDVFDQHAGFWETAGGFLVHNIPTVVIIIILLLSWKKPWIGGIGFAALGIAWFSFVPGESLHPVIYVPVFIIAAMFFLDWFLTKKA